jgi:hypothetical protein
MAAGDPDDRLEALARLIDLHTTMLDQAFDLLRAAQLEIFALRRLAVQKGLVSEAELATLIARMRDESEIAVELAPEHGEFRRLRRLLQEQLDEEQGDDGGDDGPTR